jgi:integrase
MADRLTDASVKRLPLPERASKIHPDGDVPGFGCRVTAAGARSYVLRYRVRGSGRERTYTIGSTGDWQAAAARAEAKRLRRLIDQGEDPLGAIEDQRAAPTMADLIERFIGEHVEPRLRPETVRHYRMLIDRHIRPHFGAHLKVADVSFADIDSLHRKISKTGASYAANRAVAICSKMFTLAIRWNMRSDNPTRGIERNLESKRKRYLTAAELARLTAALAAPPSRQAANVIRLLLLTGCRRGEACAMRWGDLDLTAGIWTKLGSTTKQKTDHVAPLSGPARQLLSEIRAEQIANNRHLGTWVFPSSESRTGHIVELAHAWRLICKDAGITGLRVHDLRHSFASQLASGGATLPLIAALLGHSNPATTARYAHLLDDPMRAAVEKVGAVVAAAGKDAEATIVEGAFPPKRRPSRT